MNHETKTLVELNGWQIDKFENWLVGLLLIEMIPSRKRHRLGTTRLHVVRNTFEACGSHLCHNRKNEAIVTGTKNHFISCTAKQDDIRAGKVSKINDLKTAVSFPPIYKVESVSLFLNSIHSAVERDHRIVVGLQLKPSPTAHNSLQSNGFSADYL